LKGSICKSTALVKAFLFSEDNVEEEPIPVPLAPLELECHPELVTEISAPDDVYWALNHDIKTAKIYDFEEMETYKVNEIEPEIKLKGRGEILQMAIAARPLEYDGTFENWYNLAQVEKVCHPSVIVLRTGNVLSAGISSAVSYKSKSLIKNIDLTAFEGVSLLYDTQAVNFNKYDIYSKSFNDPNYFVRTRDLLYLNFNFDVNGTVINNFFNMNKFPRPVLKLKLLPSLQTPAKNGNLSNIIQILVFTKHISGIYGVCDSMANATLK
jgi:hypothetical protein